jgi:hypothetical protein
MTIWRRLLTGEKEPEAFIDLQQRAEVRAELKRVLWRRCRRHWYVVPMVSVLIVVLAVIGVGVSELVADNRELIVAVIGALAAAGGVLGVSRVSSDKLLWEQSLARVVCRETLVVDALMPPVRATRRRDVRLPRGRRLGV